MTPGLHAARWWHPAERGKLLCTLCPRYCLIGEGQAGFCYIRQNHGGQLVSAGYGRSTGFAVDPIEKKPLNHFLPADEIEAEIVHLAAHGNRVFTERVDRFRFGEKRVELPCAGVFEIRDGKIAAWRDYFDLATWQRQTGQG